MSRKIILIKQELLLLVYEFFFCQAEDGIRDRTVTGVQTCALPICASLTLKPFGERRIVADLRRQNLDGDQPIQSDRKSTRLNSSHRTISYAVFCLKKKKEVIRYLEFLHQSDFLWCDDHSAALLEIN